MLEKYRKKTRGIYKGKGKLKLGRREEEKMKARQR